MEFFGYDRNKVLWGEVDNHVVKEENYYDEKGLRGFGFYFSDKDKKRVGKEGLSGYTYLFILMKLWPG